MNIDDLKAAIEKAGFRVASEEEFKSWLAQADAYHASEEGQLRSQTMAVYLDYCTAHAKYRFTDAMGEISGFGGGYEQCCRIMLDAGLRWLDEHPHADPRFSDYGGVFGVLREDNDDAKALSKAVVDASGGDCTGAMHHAVLSHAMFVRKNGWPAYVEHMSQHEAGEGEA